MSPLGASVAATLVASLASAALVLWFELVALDPAYRAAQPLPPWAAATAMSLFALAMGAISIRVAAPLGRWFPPGLVVFGLGVLAIGVGLSRLALATTPVEAPLYIALHVVFVVAFGLFVPLAWRG